MLTALGIDHLPLFIVSGLLLNIAPGQDTFYILGQSVTHGRRAGAFAVLGILSGCLVHTCAAAFGLSTILATSADAYHAVKLVGAAYLVHLGLKMLTARATLVGNATVTPTHGASMASAYRGGVLSNVLNPKTALFFLAFLPQFVSPGAEHRVLSFLFLGVLFVVNSIPWCAFLVWAASSVRRRISTAPRAVVFAERGTGAVLTGLGLKLGLEP